MADQVRAVSIDTENGWLVTSWDDGETRNFPFCWLRDNCQCSSCWQPVSMARFFLMRNLDPNIVASHAKIGADQITITWPDDHKSPCSFQWLLERSWSPKERQEREKWYQRKPLLWGVELQSKIPTVDFEQMLTDDMALYRWITSLEDYGLCLLTGAPTTTGQVNKIADRVAYLRVTNYGPTFTVKAKNDPSNLAYTSATLGLHTDEPFYEYVPGVQMLHCIVQTKVEGGENEFSDGFNAACQMRKDFPDYFKSLTETTVDNYDVGNDYIPFYLLNRNPVIRLNKEGEPDYIRYCNQDRDTHLNVPLDEVRPWYRAMRKYEELLYHPNNLIKYKLKEGDIACFDNHRVLHGRMGYTEVGQQQRHLQGMYLDWDEMCSRRRRLMQTLNLTD